ncbi:MAG TPA: hypothetical protein VFL17_24180, partial [Anaerolineae bacterium]|nr:hypothetical protein [Anaerolineae bacterium]
VSLIWLTRAYDHVVKGEASVEEALAAAQDLFDDYRTCVIARNALSDPDTQQACQKEVDPTLPDFATGGD